MKTVNFSVSSNVELTYDPKSKAFKNALKRYQKEINNDATAQEMLEWVATNVARWGCDDDIMGVGFVYEPIDHLECPQPWCGVLVDSYDETANVQITSIVVHGDVSNSVIAGDSAIANHITIIEEGSE